MRKSYFFACLSTLILASILNLHAQNPNVILSWNIQDTTQIKCDSDTNLVLRTTKGLDVYQTYNDKWDGVKDSTQCINLWDTVAGQITWQVDTQEIDINKPLFIVLAQKETTPDTLFHNSVYLGEWYNFLLDTSKSCTNGFCSGLILAIEIPDSVTNQTIKRWHHIPFKKTTSVKRLYCLATEKFEGSNLLRKAIFKLKFKEPKTKKLPIDNQVWFYKMGDQIPLTNNNLSNFRTSYNKYFFERSYTYLATHENGYPSDKNISYLEPVINPNKSEIDTINVTVEEETSFIFQPFTQMRAGLIDGSDSIRHILNFVSNGDLCFIPFIDVFLEDDAQFVYQSGRLEFLGKTSCLGFGKGAKLVIPNNTTLKYGVNTGGMLNLKTGGTIVIGNNAELVVGNTLIMNEYKHEVIPQNIFMTLNKGSKLTFANGSHLINDYSIDGSIKLNIYMNGGELDVRGLPVEERRLINLIYPSNNTKIEEELVVYIRPGSNSVYVHFNSVNPSDGHLALLDINGKQLHSKTVSIHKGENYWKLSDRKLPEGIYLVTLNQKNKLITKKLIQQ